MHIWLVESSMVTVLRKASLSEALAPYDRVERYTYFPLHLLVYHYKSSHDLINYARAHSSLWLHTEVSSMNNLMIPLSLGGGP